MWPRVRLRLGIFWYPPMIPPFPSPMLLLVLPAPLLFLHVVALV